MLNDIENASLTMCENRAYCTSSALPQCCVQQRTVHVRELASPQYRSVNSTTVHDANFPEVHECYAMKHTARGNAAH